MLVGLTVIHERHVYRMVLDTIISRRQCPLYCSLFSCYEKFPKEKSEVQIHLDVWVPHIKMNLNHSFHFRGHFRKNNLGSI